MGKNKTFKIEQTKVMPNILEFPRDKKGKWHTFFGNDNPLVLELACGKGHYTLALARKYKNKNVLGIDIKGPRLWKGGSTAIEEGLNNAAFIRMQIDHISEYFAPDEVDEIWVTFPDPQPKKERKRLTHPVFLKQYESILRKGALIHLKTDNTSLFEFTLGVLAGKGIQTIDQSRNLYHSELYKRDLLQVKTHYEKLFVAEGSKIKYCSFQLS